MGTVSLLPLITHGKCLLKITSVGEDVEKREPLCVLVIGIHMSPPS